MRTRLNNSPQSVDQYIALGVLEDTMEIITTLHKAGSKILAMLSLTNQFHYQHDHRFNAHLQSWLLVNSSLKQQRCNSR